MHIFFRKPFFWRPDKLPKTLFSHPYTLFAIFKIPPKHYKTGGGETSKKKSWTKFWRNLGPSFDSKTPNLGPSFDSTAYIYKGNKSTQKFLPARILTPNISTGNSGRIICRKMSFHIQLKMFLDFFEGSEHSVFLKQSCWTVQSPYGRRGNREKTQKPSLIGKGKVHREIELFGLHFAYVLRRAFHV